MKKLLTLGASILLGLACAHAAEGDIEISVTRTGGTTYKDEGAAAGTNATNTVGRLWKSNTDGNNPRLLVKYSNSGNNLVFTNSDNKMDFRGEGGGTHFYLQALDKDGNLSTNYYVSRIRFKCHSGTNTQTINGVDVSGDDDKEFDYTINEYSQIVGQPAKIYVNSNVITPVTDFIVTLSPVTLGQTGYEEVGVPTESGWYVMRHFTGLSLRLGQYMGLYPGTQYAATTGAGAGYYPLSFQSPALDGSDALNYLIYIDKTQTGISNAFRTVNGLWLAQSVIVSQTPANTNITLANATYNSVKLGGYYTQHSNEIPYVGQGSGASGNTNKIYKLDTQKIENAFDVWTVSILNDVKNTTNYNYKDDAQITITNENNLGYPTCYNGGKFFLKKGTVLTSNDFTAVANNDRNATIDIIPGTKTIIVDYNPVTGTIEDIKASIDANIESKVAELKAYRSLLGETKYQEFVNELNAYSPTDSDTRTELSSKNGTVNGYNVHVKCITACDWRSFFIKKNGKYLSGNNTVAQSTNNVNLQMVDNPIEHSTWLVWHQDNYNWFYIFNCHKNSFVTYDAKTNPSGHALNGAGKGVWAKFVPATEEGKVYILIDNDKYLTENNGTISISEDPDAWEIELSGITSEDQLAVGKHYRIRAYSATAKDSHSGTLVGLSGNYLENGKEPDNDGYISNESTKIDNLATIWTLQPASDGKYYLANVAFQYPGSASMGTLGFAGVNTFVGSGAAFEIKPCMGNIDTYNKADPSAFYIKNTGGNYFTGTSTTPTFVQDTNGSTVFYIQEVSDAEYAAIEAAYIAKAPGNGMSAKVDAYVATGIWSEEAGDACKTAIPNPTTILQANTPIDDAWNEFYTSPENQLVQFTNAGRSSYTNKIIGLNGTSDQLYGNSAYTSPNTMWELIVDHENNGFKLKNHRTGKYVTNPTARQSGTTFGDDVMVKADATTEADAYTFDIVYTAGKTGLAVSDREATKSQLHLRNDNNTPQIFKYSGLNDAATYWDITRVEDIHADIKHTVAKTDNGHVLTISSEDGTVRHHAEGYHETHKISLTKKDEGDIQTMSLVDDGTIAESDITETTDGYSINLGALEPSSTYVLSVPQAYYKVGTSKVSAPYTVEITTDAQGNTTGIDEVEAPAAKVVYDLQGRKLSKPTRGINIIGGQKVLVK